MKNYLQEELQNALKVVSSTISRCEKIQPKFKEGTSQFSLLRNRIKALKISKCLIEKDESMQIYTKDELEKALPPVISIINKTEKAQSKYDEGTTPFKRFSPIISAMYISKALIEKEIAQRDPS
ncbi:MAG: hypothetical protein SOY04_03085 [Clostridium celatum]|nr:hypothetical protein [Clostridium celatum]